jgi:glycosyltransferase involved in cell wall biosynthesis
MVRNSDSMKPKVCKILDTGIIGGPGKGIFQVLKYALPDDLDYILCTFEYKTPKSTEFIEGARARNLNLRLIKQHFRLDPSPIFQIYKIIKNENCNIIESHGYKGHLIACALSKLLRIPWVAVSHGWTTEDWKVRLYHSLDLVLLPFANAALTVSPQLQDTISKLRGPGKLTRLIYNAVDQAEIHGKDGGQAVRKSLGLDQNQILLGCFGRLSPEKGQQVLLEAFEIVSRENKKVCLVLVGDGPRRAYLEDMAKHMPSAGQVFFVGYQAAMRDYFEAIDLLVLPSLSEGLPNVVLEAMAMGVPVVATKVGAVDLAISDQDNGYLVEPGDAQALGSAIVEALRDRPKLTEIGKRGQDSLFPRFSPQERVKEIIRIYQEMLADV